jgi:hypothetical protein
MPKIFLLRHQLVEQQARLKQLAKYGEHQVISSPSSDEDAAGTSQRGGQQQQSQDSPLDLQHKRTYAPRPGKAPYNAVIPATFCAANRPSLRC